MAERLSIYAGQPITEALAALGERFEENRSSRLNTVCERYMAMVADELTRINLSKGEWCAILDANNGVIPYSGSTLMPSGLWANVHDSGPELGTKWEIDLPTLVAKLQAMPKTTLIVLQEACDRFWSHCEKPTEEALVIAGIRPRLINP